MEKKLYRAQICVAKTLEAAKEFAEANDFSARGKWSMTSVLGQNIITKVFNSSVRKLNYYK